MTLDECIARWQHVPSWIAGPMMAAEMVRNKLEFKMFDHSGSAIDMADNCILYPWVMRTGLRHQGALLGAIRGCDLSPKEDASKALTRVLRNEILRAHCGDPAKSASFIEAVNVNELENRMIAFLKNCDHYPLHYITHLMMAAQIIGYKKPSISWKWFYEKLCKTLHVNPETEEQLDRRLNCDEAQFAKDSKANVVKDY